MKTNEQKLYDVSYLFNEYCEHDKHVSTHIKRALLNASRVELRECKMRIFIRNDMRMTFDEMMHTFYVCESYANQLCEQNDDKQTLNVYHDIDKRTNDMIQSIICDEYTNENVRRVAYDVFRVDVCDDHVATFINVNDVTLYRVLTNVEHARFSQIDSYASKSKEFDALHVVTFYDTQHTCFRSIAFFEIDR
jgi:hypothetical protein